MSASVPIRCVLLIDTVPGVEATGSGLVDRGVAYRSLGFSLWNGRDGDHALAIRLRELADMLDAPDVPDEELV